jgi:hypothetical protein
MTIANWPPNIGVEPYYQDKWRVIYKGDCKDILPLLPANSIDLVLADPPYPKEFQYTYGYMADLCPRLLTRGASLITIVGHYAIPDIISMFSGKLKYRWMFCMSQFSGVHARMAMGIEVTWKPCLWYVKDAYPQGRGFIVDGFVVTGTDGQRKSNHKWEQDRSWADFFVNKLTSVHDVVLDPMLGSGTTLLSATNANRLSIGIEISEEYCEIAANRCIADCVERLQKGEY